MEKFTRFERSLIRDATDSKFELRTKVLTLLVAALNVGWLAIVVLLQIKVFHEARLRGRELHGISSPRYFVGRILRKEDADLLEMTDVAGALLLAGGAVFAMLVFTLFANAQARIIRRLAERTDHVSPDG